MPLGVKNGEIFRFTATTKESTLLVLDENGISRRTCPNQYDDDKNKHIVQQSFDRLRPSCSQ